MLFWERVSFKLTPSCTLHFGIMRPRSLLKRSHDKFVRHCYVLLRRIHWCSLLSFWISNTVFEKCPTLIKRCHCSSDFSVWIQSTWNGSIERLMTIQWLHLLKGIWLSMHNILNECLISSPALFFPPWWFLTAFLIGDGAADDHVQSRVWQLWREDSHPRN